MLTCALRFWMTRWRANPRLLTARHSPGFAADSGPLRVTRYALVLRKAGRTSLVRCKQWKTVSVDAPVIREMFGLMVAENANETMIVTSGNFTRDAQNFAKGKPIRLVDGPRLLALVRSVQSAPAGPVITPATGPRQPMEWTAFLLGTRCRIRY